LLQTLPMLEHVVVVGDRAPMGTMTFEQFCAVGEPSREPGVVPTADDLAALVYTSGTTGRPKGAMLTHGNLLANIDENSNIPAISVRSDDIVWLAPPLFHIYGMNVGMNNPIRYGGTTLVVERFDPVSTLEGIQKHR